jgi:hypothetical protein
MSNAVHLDDDVLERYAMRRLSETEMEAVEDHIALCEHCLDRLDVTTAYVDGMRQAFRAPEAKPASRWPKWIQRSRGAPIWAGAALAAAGLFFVVSRPDRLPAPAMVVLDGTRGASTVVQGTGPFDFELFMPVEGTTYHVELLDESGAKRWESEVPGDKGKLHALVNQRISAGQYFLHVVEPVSGSQHDFAVRIE